ncbi:MAG: hypothetical protein HPY53_08945 [Brevinematales bacterium]|nr:hypothetical protein [Brevinematales bacterium]
MEKIFFIFLFNIVFYSVCFTQEANSKKSEIQEFFEHENPEYNKTHIESLTIGTNAQETKWPKVLYYNTPYCGGLLGTPTIPISFSRLVYSPDTKELYLEPSFSIGVGYTFFTGEFYFTEDNKININPYFLFGFSLDIGARNESAEKATVFSVTPGAFIGFSSFSLYVGCELMSRQWVLGIGFRLDFFSLDNSRFHVYGDKVIPVYGYPNNAKPINTEWNSAPH